MLLFYLVALGGVGTMMVLAAAEALAAVRRPAPWQLVQSEQPMAETRPAMTVVHTEDRRKQQLPFVGQDRRRANTAEAANAVPAVAVERRRRTG